MAIGNRIKKVRCLRKMTQKELGVAIGFSEKTADVRIAQYESGTRVPKENLLVKIAEVLDISLDYLQAPELTKEAELIQALLSLDEYSETDLRIEEHKVIEDGKESRHTIEFMGLDAFFEEWHNMKKALENGDISEEDYLEWKINWPENMDK
ncbi:MAG: helix-turn-helix domain-containing protein [Nitrososphaeraceae archaeon]